MAAQDETDLLLFPPLRTVWGKRGEPLRVELSGRNARRVVYGLLNLGTGQRLFEVRDHHRQEDFEAFLDLIHWHYRTRHVGLLLDRHPGHTTEQSLVLAEELDIELIWLPERAPELNPLDHLWGHGKKVVSANRQYATIEEQAELFIDYLEGLSAREALRKAGVLSDDCWLKAEVSHYLSGPA